MVRLLAGMVPITRTLNMLWPTGRLICTQVCRNDAPLHTAKRDLM